MAACETGQLTDAGIPVWELLVSILMAVPSEVSRVGHSTSFVHWCIQELCSKSRPFWQSNELQVMFYLQHMHLRVT